jgi:HK97 family phage major capsid protein
MTDGILRAARKKKSDLHEEIQTMLDKIEAEHRTLTPEEDRRFESLFAQIKTLDARITERKAEVKRIKNSLRGSAKVVYGGEGSVHIRSQPMTYGQGSGNSYLLDLAHIAASAKGNTEVPEARERMGQHLKEMAVEVRSDKKLAKQLYESGFVRPGQEIRTNPNTTAGTGGEFVPPLWLVSQYVPFARPGRTFANRVVNSPLPPGIDVINVPKLTTGSQTAIQAANAAAVQSVDIVTSTVAASVNTIAGQEDISLQLLEQSPIAMDGVVFQDLSADYDQRLDLQVISGTGSNGQHLGVLNVAQQTSNTSVTKANGVTVGSTTFFDGSTANTQARSILNGINQIETLRYASPTAIWVHPRRSNSWSYAGDSATAGAGRPYFVANQYGPFNAIGLNEANARAQGVVGELFGLPVVKDANMSTTMNATATTGGTADPIVVLKEDDMILWEGQLKLRALPEILSGTLMIRYQVYAYSAFQAQRFPPSISILTSNTNLAAPGF